MEKRPSLYSKEVAALVAKDLLPKVLEWLGGDDPAYEKPEEMERLLDQVAEAIDRGYHEGYESARHLDSRYCWSVDSELVDIFDSGVWRARHHHDALVEQWVTKNEIVPVFAVGDKVGFRDSGKDQQGEVVEVKPKLAEYTVFCGALGHTRKTDPTPKSGIRRTGVILHFEDVKAVQ